MNEHEITKEPPFDLKESIQILRRWACLLMLGLLFGIGVGLFVSTRMPAVYQATTKVLVTRTGQSQSSDVTAYLSDLQLTQTYLQLLTTKTVLDITSERTGIQIEPEDITAKAIPNTQVIEIQVKNNNPQRAALIANSLVQVLIEQNELLQTGRYDSMEESLRAQKTQIETEIQNLQHQIEQASTQSLEEQKVWLEGHISSLQAEESSLQQEIASIGIVGSPEERLLFDEKYARSEQVRSLLSLYQENYNNLLLIYDNPAQNPNDIANSQLGLLTTTRTLYQQFYATALKDLETIRLARLQNTPSVVQIEKASTPEKPVWPRIWLIMLLGGLVGFACIAGVALLQETLDDSLKTPEYVEKVLGVPVVGFVPDVKSQKRNSMGVYVIHEPHSSISEAFRSLRTNLELTSIQKPIHTILVTSPEASEGKTTVAANLAAIFSQTARPVGLLDADLRHPQIQNLLGISNQPGISDLLSDYEHIRAANCTQAVAPNLLVVPSGEISPNPAELLDSVMLSRILEDMRTLVDLVVIDSPPSFVADTQILASKVDAVLLVVRPESTHVETARNCIEMLKRTGACVVGVVMNRIPGGRNPYLRLHKRYFDRSNAL
jgi:non-specific protein-tyrosine kinase